MANQTSTKGLVFPMNFMLVGDCASLQVGITIHSNLMLTQKEKGKSFELTIEYIGSSFEEVFIAISAYFERSDEKISISCYIKVVSYSKMLSFLFVGISLDHFLV